MSFAILPRVTVGLVWDCWKLATCEDFIIERGMGLEGLWNVSCSSAGSIWVWTIRVGWLDCFSVAS